MEWIQPSPETSTVQTRGPGHQALRRRLLQALLLTPAGLGLAGPVGATTGVQVPDAALLNHDGQRVRLRSQVWRERLAVVNFVYTTCSSFCGVQSAMLAQWQTKLGARMGREVVFISLSIDPLSDDVARLHAFARNFEPGPNWWWLTGEPAAMFSTLEALGADRGDPRDHGPQWLLGRARAPSRILGLPSLAKLEAALSAAAA